jgi:hypothetical protein
MSMFLRMGSVLSGRTWWREFLVVFSAKLFLLYPDTGECAGGL